MRLVPLLLTLLLLRAPAGAYDLSEIDGDQIVGNAPILLGWEPHRFPLPFDVDATAPPGVASAAVFHQAVWAAFDSWQTGSGDLVRFREAGVSRPLTRSDLEASISSGDCGDAGDCLHLVTTVNSGWGALTGSGPSVIALTLVKYEVRSRRLQDADILLNGEAHTFDTQGRAGSFDVEGIVAHEIGHALGVAHPSSASRQASTMWAVTPPGNLELRSLETDDLDAARYLYAPLDQSVTPPDGAILGLIQRPGASGDSGNGGCVMAGPGGTTVPGSLLLLLVSGLLAGSRRRSRRSPR